MSEIPQHVIDAVHAADVAWVHDPGPGQRGGSRGTVPERQLRVLLAAAAPHLAAAERERLLTEASKLKDVYMQPDNGYLVDVVPWAALRGLIGGPLQLPPGGSGA